MVSDLNIIHFPGSYSGCLAINRDHQDKPKAELLTEIKSELILSTETVFYLKPSSLRVSTAS